MPWGDFTTDSARVQQEIRPISCPASVPPSRSRTGWRRLEAGGDREPIVARVLIGVGEVERFRDEGDLLVGLRRAVGKSEREGERFLFVDVDGVAVAADHVG